MPPPGTVRDGGRTPGPPLRARLRMPSTGAAPVTILSEKFKGQVLGAHFLGLGLGVWVSSCRRFGLHLVVNCQLRGAARLPNLGKYTPK